MNCFIFDIDGVITNPRTKVSDKLIIDLIAKKFNHYPTVFISGRALGWIEKNIINPLREQTPTQGAIDNKYVLGEFGADALEFENGKEVRKTEDIGLPREFVEEADNITNQHSEIMEVDPKKTLYTNTAIPNGDFEAYRALQNEIVDRYNELLKKYKLDDFEVHKDSVAVNVRHKGMNKLFATDKALKWLSQKGFTIEKFTVFGDSPSDLEIGQELYKQKLNFEFVYVGEEDKLPSDVKFHIHVTDQKFEKGTLEYLNSLSE